MSARRILQLGDPLLRVVSAPMASAAEAEPVFDDLRDTLHEFRRTHGFGRGISAVQIGEPKRLIYIELEGRAYRLRNPAYEFRSTGTFRLWDDCFSFPDLLVLLERSVTVRIRYQNESGATERLEANGAFSELLQHEMDHLDGVLAIDRALDGNSLATRQEWERRYRNTAPSPAERHVIVIGYSHRKLRLVVRNLTRNTMVADAADVADTGAKRRTGLLKHSRLNDGEGLWIVPCESVHTFFMKFAIDLVYLDKKHRVRKVKHAVAPWRLSACLTAHSILELPAGAAQRSGTQKGDELKLEKLP
jgi:peptide deformylase